MTFNNSILLIIKQSDGIDYNDLLLRISSRYNSRTTANAALSRALKDLEAFGLIQRQGKRILLTGKGLSSINIEMKEKLLIKLNVDFKKPLPNLEEIVQLLVVLYQRSSQSPDLLKTAKENSTFTINDIEKLREQVRAHRKNLRRMSLLLKEQAEKLKAIDFNDSIESNFGVLLSERLLKVLQNSSDKLLAEIKDPDFFASLPEQWKKKIDQKEISVDIQEVEKFFALLLQNPLISATIYFGDIKIFLKNGKATCFGPHSKIKLLLETTKPNLIIS